MPPLPAAAASASPRALALLESTDWSATPLGPREHWPRSLQTAVGICLCSRFPMFVWWGAELINLHNDGYIPILGKRHPVAFAQPAPRLWAEIWHVVGPEAGQVLRDGESTWNERVQLVVERNGFVEHAWFTWSYSPLPDDTGSGVGGLLCVCTEDTARVLAERERDALLEAARGDLARRELEESRNQFVMALDNAVRSLAEPASITATCARRLCEHLGTSRCALAEVAGDEDAFDITGDHNRGVASIVGRHRFADFGPELLQRMRDGQPCVIDDVQTHEPPIGDLAAYRRAAIRAMVCVPLRKAGRLVAMVAVHQAEPRHWSEDDIDLVRQVTTRCLESIEHARALRRLSESEERFRTAALVASSIVWTNDATGQMVGDQPGWQAFTGQSRAACQGYGWTDAVHPEDGPATVAAWERAVADRSEFVHRHRVRRADGHWRTCDIRALPLQVAHGAVREWVGVHTDITDRLAFERTLQESETRFRNVSDSAPVMIWVTRPDGHCEYLNRGWYAFTGQTPEQALGFGWLRAVHPDDAALAEAEFRDANAQRRSFRIEYRLRRHDGIYRWCIDSAVPRAGPDGATLGYIGSVIDISERKQVENALAAEKRVLELIATGSPPAAALDAIVAGVEQQCDHAVRCTILTLDAAATTLGEPEAQAGQRAPISLPIRGAGGALCGSLTLHYRDNGPPDEAHVELARAATHLAAIVLEKHALDEQLQQSLFAEQVARGEAERASRMKDEFLATLSHELRTPLSAILGWVVLLRRRGELPAEAQRGVDVIERNARAQSQIIADLLDMSAIASGKVSLEWDTVDLQSVVSIAVESARPNAAAKQVDIHCHFDTQARLDVHGDATRLQQILWNLLSNAVKFSRTGGRIDVGLSVQAQQAVLDVRDDGDGIPAAFLPHLFDRFRQADASTTRTQGGLGLGLSIVKKLVELHHGTIAAQSLGSEQGATFTVRLPLAHGVVERHADGARLAALARGVPPAKPSVAEPALRGLRVLLVDDDADGRETTQRLLEHQHVVVTPAGSAAEALGWIGRADFDALVSDIGMPQVDGYGLMRQWRALEQRRAGSPSVTAIALTAYARPEDRAKAIAAGFDLHLTKPVEPARLYAALATAVRSPAPT